MVIRWHRISDDLAVVQAPAKFTIGEPVEALRQKCIELVENLGFKHLAINLSLVTLNDSSAIGELVSMYRRLRHNIVFVKPTKKLIDQLVVTKLIEVLPIIEEEDDETIAEVFIANLASAN